MGWGGCPRGFPKPKDSRRQRRSKGGGGKTVLSHSPRVRQSSSASPALSATQTVPCKLSHEDRPAPRWQR